MIRQEIWQREVRDASISPRASMRRTPCAPNRFAGITIRASTLSNSLVLRHAGNAMPALRKTHTFTSALPCYSCQDRLLPEPLPLSRYYAFIARQNRHGMPVAPYQHTFACVCRSSQPFSVLLVEDGRPSERYGDVQAVDREETLAGMPCRDSVRSVQRQQPLRQRAHVCQRH